MSTMSLEPTRRRVYARRLLFFLLVLATVVLVSGRAWAVARVNGVSGLELGIFVLFVFLFIPMALSFWTAVIGFVVQLKGGDDLDLSRQVEAGPVRPEGLPLTAIIMPVYNEEPGRVFAGLKATYQSLERTGALGAFEFFILSDTTDPDVWVQEEAAFAELRGQISQPERVFYRNRRRNVERKTGNILDFVSNWGNRYRYMIVFDADSIMSGTSLVNLVRLMEAHPQVGIIQAPPLPVNRQSLFGRVHQFAMHVYSRVFITGLNYWQGGAGNYWGHNAIIRIQPFVEHCRLPTLPGKAPLGGSILSHDFVEAAFMRRAGWRVYLASELLGSYEEMPSSLLGYAARDRRWCQGNLQHGKLIFMPGLHLVSRLHIFMGIMGYVASPLWLLMLALTTMEGIRQTVVPHRYFESGDPLFPRWPESIAGQAIGLFLVILLFLLLPKLLSLALHLRRSVLSARLGSRFKLAASVLLETLLSSLLAPNLALLQARFVVSILLGSNAKWEAQDRGDTGTSWGEAARRHWPATALGVGWAILLLFTAPRLLPWFGPVLLGFLMSIPLSVWTSRPGVGLGAKSRGLFMIPEEIRPPQVLRDFDRAMRQTEDLAWGSPENGLERLLKWSELYELHLAAVGDQPEPSDPLKRHELEGLALKCRHEGPHRLSKQERRELMLHPFVLEELRGKDGLARAATA